MDIHEQDHWVVHVVKWEHSCNWVVLRLGDEPNKFMIKNKKNKNKKSIFIINN